ncbi:MAG: hypothetical protein WC518_02325 [Patescibacteria group bacterium]
MPLTLLPDQQKLIARERKKYLWFFLTPLALLILDFILYSLLALLFSKINPGQVAVVINAILGLVGVLAVVLIIVFAITGIIGYLTFKYRIFRILEKTEYQNLPLEQIVFILRPSLAALLVSPVFTLGNKLCLWSIIPVISWLIGIVSVFYSNQVISVIMLILGLITLVISLILTARGREWAWRREPAQNFNLFKKRQRLVNIVALIVLVLMIVTELVVFIANFNRQTLELQKNMANVSDVNNVGQEENIDAFLKIFELRGIKVTDRELFKQAMNQGLSDGGILKDIDLEKLKNPDFLLGYGVGYAAGCLKAKGDENFCQDFIKEKTKDLK